MRTPKTPATSPQARLGIDIGRVIIDGSAHPEGGDTAFFTGSEAVMLATPEVADAVETIARLVPIFSGQAWLISKCGPRVQQRSLRWLTHHRFFERTGIPETNVRFCLERRQKRDHCQDLGITHLVDDRPDVHEAVADVVPHRYLFGPQRTRHGGTRDGAAVPTSTWLEVERQVRHELARRA